MRNSRSHHAALAAASAVLLGAAAFVVTGLDLLGASGAQGGAGDAVERVSDRVAAGERSAGSERELLLGDGPYHAAPGTTLTYEVAATFETEIRAVEGPGISQAGGMLRLELGGTMAIAVLARRDQEIGAWLSFPQVRLTSAGPRGAEAQAWKDMVTDALVGGVGLRLRADGQTLGLRFPERTTGDGRNWLRTFVAAFRIVVPDGVQDAWTVEEEDNSGRLQVAYRKSEPGLTGLIRRTRHSLPGGDGDGRGTKPARSGGALARLDAGTGWPAELSLDEATAFEVPEAHTSVRNAMRATFQLRAGGRDAGASLAAFDWVGPWAGMDGSSERSESAEEVKRAARQKLVAGLRFEDILGLLERLAASGDTKAMYEQRQLLVALLLEQPGTSARVSEAVRRGVSRPALVMLLGALGKAGNAAAQAALGQFLADGTASEALRLAAVEAAFQVAAPATALVEHLAGLRGHQGESGLGESALLVLGALSTRGAGTEASQRALAAIAESELAAQRDGKTVVWLEALGNAGGALALARATPYLQSPDPDTRAAAVSALRRTDQAQSASRVAAALSDPSATVRERAIEVLAGWGAPDRMTGLIAMAESDADSGVRRAALLAVGEHRSRLSGARELLERVASRDPVEDLRALARELASRG